MRMSSGCAQCTNLSRSGKVMFAFKLQLTLHLLPSYICNQNIKVWKQQTQKELKKY